MEPIAGPGAAAAYVASGRTSGSYVAYAESRVALMGGERGWAVALLDSVLQRPAQLSRGWLRIDRSLDPLRGEAGFQALIAGRP